MNPTGSRPPEPTLLTAIACAWIAFLWEGKHGLFLRVNFTSSQEERDAAELRVKVVTFF